MDILPDPSSIAGDIAVIGLSCRFPGASNCAEFWHLLQAGKTTRTGFSQHQDKASPSRQPRDASSAPNTPGGHFLDDDISAFDAPFFGKTPQQAKSIEPTARLLLEVAYEALENAGLAISGLVGSKTGCFVACNTIRWESTTGNMNPSAEETNSGNCFSSVSNRISQFYGFRGQSLTMDTVSSSSLVGLHLACQSLRLGESKLAVVSGANIILDPNRVASLADSSEDLLSKPSADGIIAKDRGEGVATVIIKPLADAIRDGDSVRALIRATGVNQAGQIDTNLSISDVREELIHSTYRSAALDYNETTYCEVNGAVDDDDFRVELTAVASAFDTARQGGKDFLVGSLQYNLGDLEGAAGLAGIVKSILMMENGIIPPSIHKSTKRLPLERWKLSMPETAVRWPSNCLRRVSVNNISHGGTNAHAILDDATEYLTSRGLQNSTSLSQWVSGGVPQPRLFVFSAQNRAALERMRRRYSDHLESYLSISDSKFQVKESAYLDQLAYTLSERRSQFDWKAHVLASSINELQHHLSNSMFQPTQSSRKPRVAFLFPDQVAQWAGQGLDLLSYPVFKASVLDAEHYLKETLECEWSVMDELQRGSNMRLTSINQPMTTVLQIALVDLLKSWNITPAAIIGSTSGEIGGAYAYGALSREDAWTVSYWRGKLSPDVEVQTPGDNDSMIVVGLSRIAAQEYVSKIHGELTIIAVNSPSSVIISGDDTAINCLAAKLKAGSVFCRKLKMLNAYTSQQTKPVSERYLGMLSGIRPKTPESKQNVIMASTVTGKIIKHSELGPEYWIRNLVSPSLFSDTIQTLFANSTDKATKEGCDASRVDVLIDIGPNTAINSALQQVLEDQSIVHVAMTSKDSATKTAVNCAGALYTWGFPVSVAAVNKIHPTLKPMNDLPSYPWDHEKKYWPESRQSRDHRLRQHARHHLVGAPVAGYNELEPQWRSVLRVSDRPWLKDHVIHGAIVYPAGCIITMVVEAIKQLASNKESIAKIHMRDTIFSNVIVIPEDQDGIECFLRLRRQKLGSTSRTEWWQFTISTGLEDQPLEENVSGLAKIEYRSDAHSSWAFQRTKMKAAIKAKYEESKELCARQIVPKDFYEKAKHAGLEYGPSFQGLTEIITGSELCCTTLLIPEMKGSTQERNESPHTTHPTTLDIMAQSAFAALQESKELAIRNAAIPISVDHISISMDTSSTPGSKFQNFCVMKKDGPREAVADISMSDEGWEEPKVHIKNMRYRELPVAFPRSSSNAGLEGQLGTFVWKPDVYLCSEQSLGRYLSRVNPTRTLEGNVHKVVDLIAHKNPAISILQLGGSLSTTTSLLSALEGGPLGTPRFSKVIIADTDRTHAEDFEKAFPGRSSTLMFILLDEDLDLQGQAVQLGSFDLIITAASFGNNKQKTRFFQDIQGLLQPRGIFLLLESFNDISKISDWKRTVIHSGLWPIGLFPQASTGTTRSRGTALCVAAKSSVESGKPSGTVYIVQPPASTGKTFAASREVVLSLSNWSVHAQLVSWPPDPSELKDKSIISLLELENSFLHDISPTNFDLLSTIVTQSSSFLWVSTGQNPMMAEGRSYLRILKNEIPTIKLRYLQLEYRGRELEDFAGIVTKVALNSTEEGEFVEIYGQLCIDRWLPDEGISRLTLQQDGLDLEKMALEKSRTVLKLVARSFGQDRSIYFTTDTDLDGEASLGEVEIVTKAVSVSTSNPISNSDQQFLHTPKEFSGIVRSVGRDCSRIKPGYRVYASHISPYRSVYRVKERLCQQIPGDRTYEEAATWSITLATAFQSLVRIADLGYGQTVLVQDASSAVGQAAVQIAQVQLAVVFATVRSEQDCPLVEKLGIPKERILNDADPELRNMVDIVTEGKGFDAILHTSVEEGPRMLWHCIAPYGHLISTVAASTDTLGLDMAPFQKGCSFAVVDMRNIIQDNPALMAQISQSLAEYLSQHPLRSIHPIKVIPAAHVGDAFKSVDGEEAQVVLSFDQKDLVPIHPTARHPLRLRKAATYVLAGDLGDWAQTVSRLLVDHGARHLMFLSGSGPESREMKPVMNEIQSGGTVVKIYTCDVADEQSLKMVLEECSKDMPPVRGVIHNGAVLQKVLQGDTLYKQWHGTIRPRMQCCWLLHKLLPKDIDFFLMLSLAVPGAVGSRGQATYAAVRTFQGAVAKHRRDQNLPAVALDLGHFWGLDVLKEKGTFANVAESETTRLAESQLLVMVKAAIVGSYGESVMPPQVVIGSPSVGMHQENDLDKQHSVEPRLSLLRKTILDKIQRNTEEETKEPSTSLATRLTDCKSQQEASQLIGGDFCRFLATRLPMAVESIDVNKPLRSYGVDSLLAVEIRAWVMEHTEVAIGILDLLGGASIARLSTKIATASKLMPAGLE